MAIGNSISLWNHLPITRDDKRTLTIHIESIMKTVGHAQGQNQRLEQERGSIK